MNDDTAADGAARRAEQKCTEGGGQSSKRAARRAAAERGRVLALNRFRAEVRFDRCEGRLARSAGAWLVARRALMAARSRERRGL